MKVSVQGLAAELQLVLGETAERAARQAGWLVRMRKLSGAGFVQALVLGWLADPGAKLDDLAALLNVAPQSLHERLNAKAVACLQRVLRAALGTLMAGRAETIPLLRRFTEVCIEDTTSIPLPASLGDTYPGCGGSYPDAGKAGLKFLVQLEAITGRIRLIEPAAATTSDHTFQEQLPQLPTGALRLVDLGFFDIDRMQEEQKQGTFWISRIPARMKIREIGNKHGCNISEWLKGIKTDQVDRQVRIGFKGALTCRIVAIRTPKEIVEKRLERLEKKARKQGRKVSEAQRLMCRWTILITNLTDEARFKPADLWVLYRLRWQVELMFKRWKSEGGLARSRGRIGNRVLCEFLAKLIAVIIKHWASLLRGGPLNTASSTRMGSRVRWWTGRLQTALAQQDPLQAIAVLTRLKSDLDHLPKRPRRNRPTTRQTLYAPRIAA